MHPWAVATWLQHRQCGRQQIYNTKSKSVLLDYFFYFFVSGLVGRALPIDKWALRRFRAIFAKTAWLLNTQVFTRAKAAVAIGALHKHQSQPSRHLFCQTIILPPPLSAPQTPLKPIFVFALNHFSYSSKKPNAKCICASAKIASA